MGQGSSRPSISQILSSFSDSLVPSDAYYHKGMVEANRIFNVIRKHRKDVARCLVGGGIGKRTAISENDDFDLYVFLNYVNPPFDTVLGNIMDILRFQSDYYDVRIINGTTLRIIKDSTQFDLSVGVNFAGIFSDQRKSAVGRIKELYNKNDSYVLYGPSLAEYSVKFVRRRCAFTHQVIRLAKFWNSNIACRHGYISGRSLIIELVAIQAVRDVGQNGIYLTTIRFLELMSDFKNLNVYFTEWYSDSWYWNEIPTKILKERPLVLDPVNPYNNLACSSFASVFSGPAASSLHKLKNWEGFLEDKSNISLDSLCYYLL